LYDRRHLSEIAFAGGFSTLTHFCRTFRARFGMSPGEYREYARRRRS
jgi:AraC-like DNA-binding protein